jgi:hypothetical protein
VISIYLLAYSHVVRNNALGGGIPGLFVFYHTMQTWSWRTELASDVCEARAKGHRMCLSDDKAYHTIFQFPSSQRFWPSSGLLYLDRQYDSRI